jgi:hypothetical protein
VEKIADRIYLENDKKTHIMKALQKLKIVKYDSGIYHDRIL